MTEATKKIKIFSEASIELALSQHFPYAPEKDRKEITERILKREWPKSFKIVRAVSTIAHNQIRHRHTDYMELLNEHGLERDEARAIVKAEVDEIFEYWHSGEDLDKPNVD